MKKKILICVTIMMCIAMAAQGTIAYTTRQETARNVITSGSVVVEILQQEEGSDAWQPYEAEDLAVKPSSTISKCVAVESKQEAAWVRAKCAITFTDAQGAQMNLDEQTLETLVAVAVNIEDWVYDEGWWYYPVALEQGERTEPFFDSITFSNAMGNAFQGSTVHFDVIVQAVQKANNGSVVWEAAGWE